MKKSNKKGQKPHKPETTEKSRQTGQQSKQRVHSSTFLTLPKRLWEIFAGIAVIVGFVAIFYPRVSVSPSASFIDPKNTSIVPFVISNDGNIPITDVDGVISIKKIEFKDGRSFIGPDNFAGGLLFTPNHAPHMKPGEKLTVFSPLEAVGNGIVFADIAVSVQFKLPITGTKMEKKFRFTTKDSKSKQLDWYPQPLSK